MRRLSLHFLLPMLIMLAPGAAHAAPPPATVTVAPPAATVTVGQTITLAVTVNNTGTTLRAGGLRLIAGGGFTLRRFASADATTELSGAPTAYELPVAIAGGSTTTWQVTLLAPANPIELVTPLRAVLPAVFGAAEGGVDYPGGAQYPASAAATTNVVAAIVPPTPTPAPAPAPTLAPTPAPTPTPTPLVSPKNETVELALALSKDPFKRKTFAPYFAGRLTDRGVALTRPWCRNLSGTVAISRRLGSRRVSLGAPLSLAIRHRAGGCEVAFGTKSNRLPSAWRGRSYEFKVRIRAKKRLSWNGGAPTKPATLTKRYTLRVG